MTKLVQHVVLTVGVVDEEDLGEAELVAHSGEEGNERIVVGPDTSKRRIQRGPPDEEVTGHSPAGDLWGNRSLNRVKVKSLLVAQSRSVARNPMDSY